MTKVMFFYFFYKNKGFLKTIDEFCFYYKKRNKNFHIHLFLKRGLVRDQKNFLKIVLEEVCSKIIKVVKKLLT